MRRPEQQLQIAVADFLRLALKPPTLWTAFPAGGGGRVRGAFLKAMGLQAGWPDVLVIDRGPNVIGLELKVIGGRQSPQQAIVEGCFKGCACWYILCRSVEEVEKALRFCKVPLYATVLPRGGADKGTIEVKAVGV